VAGSQGHGVSQFGTGRVYIAYLEMSLGGEYPAAFLAVIAWAASAWAATRREGHTR
jgi:hypothetical protein